MEARPVRYDTRGHNGRWKWIAGVAVAALLTAASGTGGVAWKAYEEHGTTLGRHGEAIARLTALAEAQQRTLERIEKALAALAAAGRYAEGRAGEGDS